MPKIRNPACGAVFRQAILTPEPAFQGFPVMARSEALQKYPNALILLAFGTERPEEITELLALSRTTGPLLLPMRPFWGAKA